MLIWKTPQMVNRVYSLSPHNVSRHNVNRLLFELFSYYPPDRCFSDPTVEFWQDKGGEGRWAKQCCGSAHCVYWCEQNREAERGERATVNVCVCMRGGESGAVTVCMHGCMNAFGACVCVYTTCVWVCMCTSDLCTGCAVSSKLTESSPQAPQCLTPRGCSQMGSLKHPLLETHTQTFQWH